MDDNCCLFIGRLASEVRYNRYTESGRTRATGRLIVNRQGSKKNEYDVIPFVGWDNTADVLRKFTTKGKQLRIRGPIRTNTTKDEDGNYVNYFELEIHSLGLGNDPKEIVKTSVNVRRGRTPIKSKKS